MLSILLIFNGLNGRSWCSFDSHASSLKPVFGPVKNILYLETRLTFPCLYGKCKITKCGHRERL